MRVVVFLLSFAFAASVAGCSTLFVRPSPVSSAVSTVEVQGSKDGSGTPADSLNIQEHAISALEAETGARGAGSGESGASGGEAAEVYGIPAVPAENPPSGEAGESELFGDGDNGEGSDSEVPEEFAEMDEAGACEDEACEDEGLESLLEQTEIDPERRFTADLSDEELQRLWVEDVEALGTISMGFAHSGRIINAVPFPKGELWTVVSPSAAWTVSEVVEYVTTAIETVEREHPGSPKLRVNHLSARNGGPLRPHSSHQNGRDVDLAFYYKTDVRPGYRGKREHLIDPARNWTLVRSLATDTDVQVILVDNRIQRVLYNHALSIGEDQEWLDSLFGFRGGNLLRHFRRHYDHYHIRFYAPRSQELGRRVQPLLAQRPEENRTIYRVRRGDTLSHIARRYGTSVRAIQRANNMRSTFLSVGRRLVIPLRKPCTICPLPPVVELPPRRLPPEPSPTLVSKVEQMEQSEMAGQNEETGRTELLEQLEDAGKVKLEDELLAGAEDSELKERGSQELCADGEEKGSEDGELKMDGALDLSDAADCSADLLEDRS